MAFPLASSGLKTLPDVSVAHSLLQMAIALVVVVACIWGLGKILARLRSGGRGSERRSARSRRPAASGLSVVSRQSLGKDVSIATVKWGDREVLVGIAGSTITFLNDARPDGAPVAASEETWPRPGAASHTAPDGLFAAARTDAPRLLASVAARHTRDAEITAPGRQTSFLEALRNATQRH